VTVRFITPIGAAERRAARAFMQFDMRPWRGWKDAREVGPLWQAARAGAGA
jgi:hypothetical protein